jgi:thiol-disulfide isomerase/thioredoxin
LKVSKGRRFLLPLLMLFSIAALAAFHTRIKEKPNEKEIKEIEDYVQESKKWDGRVAPNFEVRLRNGKDFELADEVGRNVIVLNFFATWCGPCRAEMPELNRYYLKNKEEHFELIGIDANETPDLVDQFVHDLKVPFPVGIDQQNIQALYKVDAYPTTVVVGIDGKVHYYKSGTVSNAEVTFDPLLRNGEDGLKKNQGVTKAKYLEALKHQPDTSEKPKYAKLNGRPRTIAEQMDCVCGCSSKLLNCECTTSDKIVKKLQTMDLQGKTDQEIILALNKEFCVGSKHND